MGLSEAMLFAFAATIICAFAIAEKIIDIEFILHYYANRICNHQNGIWRNWL